jgi:tetratricopeptide (TPR) repeat protein
MFTSETKPLEGLTPIDIEKELFKIKRRIGSQYSKGLYKEALGSALELEENVARHLGKKNAVYASCLNNVALMNKMLGNSDAAMTKYTEALHAYSDLVGKKHTSYISTLANLGKKCDRVFYFWGITPQLFASSMSLLVNHHRSSSSTFITPVLGSE